MIKPHLKPNIKTNISTLYVPINSSEEARICLECPLPAEKCGMNKCKRYKEEKAKLVKRLKDGKKENSIN